MIFSQIKKTNIQHMENFRKKEEIYNDRVKRFVEYLKKINPEWIVKRTWFEDLQAFELGESFFYKVLFADNECKKDKGDFYLGIVIYAMIDLTRKVGAKRDYLEAGFKIEDDIDIEETKEEHEKLLGYTWWRTIYKKANNVGQFSEEEVLSLEKKRKEFAKRINRIDNLS
jgi:hypothetical protein